MLTDIVDSTQLNVRLGDERMAPLWSQHDAQARQLIRLHGGQEVGRSDGFLILFRRAVDAVEFALAYHRSLRGISDAMKARVGIHTGQVTLRENSPEDRHQGATPFEIDGVALPVAARFMAAARSGQTLVSAAVIENLVGSTAHRCLSHGHWSFKGLDDPLEVIEVGDDLAPFLPPADSAKAYRVIRDSVGWCTVASIPHRLPAEQDRFIGRQEWLRHLRELLDETRLVTVFGAGGVGKTRLVQRFAQECLGGFPGGAWFCDLSSATTAEGVTHAVAQGLDVPLSGGDPIEQIAQVIESRGSCLVLLDNFEQVARHALATVAVWLQRSSEARFIITSREVLGLGGEAILALGPMEVEEAMELFMRRMDQFGGTSAASPQDQPVRDLVQLLDHLPLAIELAAARARVMSVGDLLKGMGNRFKLLARRTGPVDRQSTLRATMDWSWALLSEAEQLAASQVSAFEGGFTLCATERVVDLSSLGDAAWVGDVLQGLVEKAIVRRMEGDRFDMLRTVHDYMAGKLAGLPLVRETTLRRHWEYFATFDENEVGNGRCRDLDNIVAAARRAAEGGDPDAATQNLVVAAAVLQRVGPIAAVLQLVERVRHCAGLSPSAEAAISRVTGNAMYSLGDRGGAMAEYERGLQRARAAADNALVVRLSCAIFEPSLRAGDLPGARDHLDRAASAAERCQDPSLKFIVLNAEGSLALAEGRLDDASRHYLKALDIASHLGHRRREGGVLGNLGNVMFAMQHHDEAADFYRRAIAIGEEVGDRRWAANACCNLGLLHSEVGDHALAIAQLQAAVLTAREVGDSSLEATALCNLGLAQLATASSAEAEVNFDAAASIAVRLEHWSLALQSFQGLCDARLQRDVLRGAADALAKAINIAERIQSVSDLQSLTARREKLESELAARGDRP
ncbi:tetratricopeptide repeat protein [Aquincola sp. S2]|uniref:Tetratricopeptide repeat protein n=1 Tax=Pseudaquabacterium terrae TaxID=2732868 RepID=A0ABX2EF68_9BURK|nr:tetratricopeptide repeat protein [Aquabacterium terrae]